METFVWSGITIFGGEEVFRGNLSTEDLSKHFKISDTSISEILRIWTDIEYEANIYSIEQLKAQNLFINSFYSITEWKLNL